MNSLSVVVFNAVTLEVLWVFFCLHSGVSNVGLPLTRLWCIYIVQQGVNTVSFSQCRKFFFRRSERLFNHNRPPQIRWKLMAVTIGTFAVFPVTKITSLIQFNMSRTLV